MKFGKNMRRQSFVSVRLNIWIRRCAVKVSHLFGIHLERDVKKDQIVEFISTIHPLTTNHSLIRVGGDGDGGYLVPDDLDGIRYLFSPGVSTKISFESELADQGIKCFLADSSVSLSPLIRSNVNFMQKFIGILDSETDISIETWMNQCIGSDESDCILQMDIEGAEYENLLTIPDEVLSRFRILVIEFHFLELLGSYFGHKVITSVFRRLTDKYHVVHIHPNNCSEVVKISGVLIHPVIEVTFLRKDRVAHFSPSKSPRHLLDEDNTSSKRTIDLLKNWRS